MSDNITPLPGARMSPKAKAEHADVETAMDAIIDAEATLDLFMTLWDSTTASASDLGELMGTDNEHTAHRAMRALQRHLKRAREAMERGAG